MSQSFTKLFASITDSTIWREPDNVRIVWITMLASADPKGRVYASVPGLADKSRVSLDACLEALEKLSSPDEWSRTKDHEGRRLEAIDGGWRLINYSKYRELRDEEAIKASKRDWWHRNKAKLDQPLEKLEHARANSIQEEEEEEEEEEVKKKAGIAKAQPVKFRLLGDSNIKAVGSRALLELDAAFELPTEWGTDAEALGWKPGQILKESERFKQYWTVGKGSGKHRSVKGWRQAWSNWLSKAERMSS